MSTEQLPDLVNGDTHPYDNALAVRGAEVDLVTRLTGDASHTPAEAQQIASSYSPLLGQFAMTAEQAGDVLSAAHAAHANKPTAEQRAGWAKDSRAALVAEYGSGSAAQVLRDAQSLLSKSPTLKANFEKLGVVDHPSVVKVLANRAQLARKNGLL